MAVRRIPTWQAALAFWALVAAIIAVRRSGAANQVDLATFALVFTSIAVEALPFILLGAIVSAAIAVYVPESAFARVAALPTRLQVPGLALCGFAFPVCECGSVPVGRRLIERGVHPAAGVAFMLSAPVLNPIVLVSTFVAYGGGSRGWELVVGRAAIGLATSIAAGFALSRGGITLRERGEHEHDHGGLKRGAFVEHLADDFLMMGRFLVLGAALSALLQTFVPQSVTSGVAGTFVLGTLAMMALAFMLSLCSEADAFVAASFTGFSVPAQVAFLAFGPIIDTKLSVLYGATFGPRFVPRLLAVAVPMCLVGSLIFGLLDVIALDVRSGRIVALGGWGAFLLWLQISGEVPRYLGPRTAWIVPVGGVALVLAAIGYALFTGDAPARPLRRRDFLRLAAVLAPPIVALCMADATLGSLAAANKLGNRGIDASQLANTLRKGSGKIDFLVIRGADEDHALAKQRGIQPGAAVSLTGFVYKTGNPLRLARFYITCCVADSVAIDVPIYGISAYKKDTWLTVTGVLDKRGGQLAVVDAKATVVKPPKHPYLVFRV